MRIRYEKKKFWLMALVFSVLFIFASDTAFAWIRRINIFSGSKLKNNSKTPG